VICFCHPYKQVEIAQKSPNGRASVVFEGSLVSGNVEIDVVSYLYSSMSNSSL
jgi:hypothetical protein